MPRAVDAASKTLTVDQQKAIKDYLAYGTVDSRSLQPHRIVATAVLLDSLAS